MGGTHGGDDLGDDFVELGGGDAPVDADAGLLRDERGVVVVLVEAVCKLLETRRDLVEMHHLQPHAALHRIHLLCPLAGFRSNIGWARVIASSRRGSGSENWGTRRRERAVRDLERLQGADARVVR